MKRDDWIKLEYEEAARLLKDSLEDIKKLLQLTFAINGGLLIISINTLRTVTDDKNKFFPLIIAILAIIINMWLLSVVKKTKEKTTYLYSKLTKIEIKINKSQESNQNSYNLSIYNELEKIDSKINSGKKQLPWVVIQALWFIGAIWLIYCIFIPDLIFEVCKTCQTHIEQTR